MEVNRERRLRSRLRAAAFITAIIFIVELAGGVLFNSLALLSDSAHVFMDVLALAISWLAHYLSTRPPSDTKTFGLHRFEVFASLINGLSLLFVSIYIFYMAVTRLYNPQEVESLGMLVVAVVGLLVNLFVAFFLKGFASDDLNVRSAYFHVIGDALASVGVIAAAIIMHYTGWTLADPIISIFIGVIIVKGALSIISEAAHILLEGVPKTVDLNKVADDIKGIEGVMDIHSLHIWSICYNIFALSAHVDLKKDFSASQAEIFVKINEKLARDHQILYTTLQGECKSCGPGTIYGKIEHRAGEGAGGGNNHGHNH